MDADARAGERKRNSRWGGDGAAFTRCYIYRGPGLIGGERDLAPRAFAARILTLRPALRAIPRADTGSATAIGYRLFTHRKGPARIAVVRS